MIAPLPSRLNLLIAAFQLAALLALLAAASFASGWLLAGLAIAYALLMNSAYAMLHEAEHGLLHENRTLNDTVGATLALFFPAPFHLLRQGHIGYHLRNRSHDEAFDFYFEGESRLWKTLQLYGILTGFFYLAVILSNLLALIHPKLLKARWGDFDRPTRALLDSLNPRYFRLIRLEAIAVFLLHGSWIWLWGTPVWKHLLTPSRQLRRPLVCICRRPPLRHRARRPQGRTKPPHLEMARCPLAEPQLAPQPPFPAHRSMGGPPEDHPGKRRPARPRPLRLPPHVAGPETHE